jgi:hypothetical protein
MILVSGINSSLLTNIISAMNFKIFFRGVMLIMIGSLFLIQEVTNYDLGGFFLPIVMITAGGLLLARNLFESNMSNHSNL